MSTYVTTKICTTVFLGTLLAMVQALTNSKMDELQYFLKMRTNKLQ